MEKKNSSYLQFTIIQRRLWGANVIWTIFWGRYIANIFTVMYQVSQKKQSKETIVKVTHKLLSEGLLRSISGTPKSNVLLSFHIGNLKNMWCQSICKKKFQGDTDPTSSKCCPSKVLNLPGHKKKKSIASLDITGHWLISLEFRCRLWVRRGHRIIFEWEHFFWCHQSFLCLFLFKKKNRPP